MEENNLELEKYKIDKELEAKQELINQNLEQGNSLIVGNLNLSQIGILAKKFASSGDMVSREYRGNPDKCFVAIYKGASLGLDAFTSLQRIAIINGRATIWGDTALALVRQSGLLEYFKEKIIEEDQKLKAVCIVKRRGDKENHVSEFSQDDAILAGLWGRNTWKTHPKRMLKYKARAFALRDIFPDILDGLHFKEEMEGEKNIKDITPASEAKLFNKED